MIASKWSGLVKYTLIFLLVIAAGLALRFLLPVFANSSAAPCQDCQPTPTAGAAVAAQFSSIDKQLKQSMSASFAYNAPESLGLNQTTTIQLLLDPSSSPEALATQTVKGGSVINGTLDITPRMKAELKTPDNTAFAITNLHDNPEQVVSASEPTKWEWLVTAKKEGVQHLTLVIYRLVKYQGQDYWREVKSYQSDIAINVTLTQRVLSLDWGWVGGVLVTAVLVPAFWRWMDHRKRRRSAAPRKPHGRR